MFYSLMGGDIVKLLILVYLGVNTMSMLLIGKEVKVDDFVPRETDR